MASSTGQGLDAHATWPLEKFKQFLERNSADIQGDSRSLAVVFATGPMSPVNLAHMQMLRQARDRLEQAGFLVCGGWLCPCHDVQASQKAWSSGGVHLSTALRLHLAKLATQEDDFISVAAWQAHAPEPVPKCSDTATRLQLELRAALPSAIKDRGVHAFLACGSNQMTDCAGMKLDRNQGIVMVPRSGHDCLLEQPQKLIFLAEAVPGRLEAVSSARLSSALQNGDTAYAIQAMPKEVSRVMLEPSANERREFAADLERLAVMPACAGPWPSDKFVQRLQAVPEGKLLAVLVASGAMNPAHRGHVLMMHQARARLEEAGYAVVAAWLSPWSDPGEVGANMGPKLSLAFRQRVAELSVCGDDFVSVGSWEATAQGRRASPQEIAGALRSYLLHRFRHSLQGLCLKSFYVSGSDSAMQHGLDKGFLAMQETGVIIVPRSGDDDLFIERPLQLVFLADGLPGDGAELSSSRLRKWIKAGETAKAAEDMAAAAARFTLAPTAVERLEMLDDFEELKVPLPEAAELARVQGVLKTTLKGWTGPLGVMSHEELRYLLRTLDPSWTTLELDSLISQAADPIYGSVNTDHFVDMIFSSCRTQTAD